MKNVFHLILISSLIFLGACSSQKKVKKMAFDKHSDSYDKLLSNFDSIAIPHNDDAIYKMIGIVQPELDEISKRDYSKIIKNASKTYKIKPQIMIALIDTESNFKKDMVSTTGDLSVAQVNHEVWNREFTRLKEPLIDKRKLISKDQTYAIMTMGKILSLLKKRHEKKDRRWYARYHSNTSKYKKAYLRKIEIRMRMLDKKRDFILASK